MARSCRYQQAWGTVEALTCGRRCRTRRVRRDAINVTEVAEWGRFQRAPVAPAFPWHLRRTDADVLVLHLPCPTAELSWLLARPRGALVVRYHSDVVRQRAAMRFYGPVQQRLLRHARFILPTSAAYLDSSPVLASHRSRCRVVPLGIEPERWQEPDERAVSALQQAYGGPFVLFAGRHRYYKGLPVLLESASRMDAPVVIAGDGPERAALMKAAAELGLPVHFPGALSHEDLVNHLHAAAVFAFPSTARSEAFGIGMLEAHAAGLPVVATRLGTGVEFVNEDGKTGLNVPPGDPGALAAAVNVLIADPDRRRVMGAYARERVASAFHAGAVAEQEWQFYREALE